MDPLNKLKHLLTRSLPVMLLLTGPDFAQASTLCEALRQKYTV
jgi:DNA polymerase III delta subunit